MSFKTGLIFIVIFLSIVGAVSADAIDLYRSTVLADGPVRYYQLEDILTTGPGDAVMDSSINGVYGTEDNLELTNDVSQKSGFITGSYAFDFLDQGLINGEDDGGFWVGDNPLSTGPMTIEYWIKQPAASTPDTSNWWLGIGVVDAEMPGYVNDFGTALIDVSGRTRLAFGIAEPAYDTTIYSSSTIDDDNWHHVAAVWTQQSGTNMYLYIDGQLEATGSGSTNNRNAPSDIRVGELLPDHYLQNYPFEGMLDEIALYNKALTAVDIDNHYGIAVGWQAQNPIPNDGQIAVETDTILQWTPGQDPPGTIIDHVLYLGTDQQAVFDADTNTNGIYRDTLPAAFTSYNPGSLDDTRKYYWRVDEKTNNQTAKGVVWEFDTVSMQPVFLTQPQSQHIDLNATAVFNVDATNPVTGDSSGLTYQWYKGDIDSGSPLTDGDNISGALTPFLTVSNAQLPDVDTYYCRATNSIGSADSQLVVLDIRALKAHWEFNNAITDSAGTNNGTMYGQGGTFQVTPNFDAEGMIGSAIVFTGGGQYVQVPRIVDEDFTIAMWINTDNVSHIPEMTRWEWGKGLVGCKNSGELVTGDIADDFGTSLLNSKFCFGVRDTAISSTTKVDDGQWHHVAATRDSFSGTMKIYVDGVEENSITGPIGAMDDSPTMTIGIGIPGFHNYRYQWVFYSGLMDDVRIYNYPLALGEIEGLVGGYVPNPPEPECVLPPVGDLNDDCVVDSKDIAKMAWHWLDDNIVAGRDKWTVTQAWDWYEQVGPLAGCNYIPRTAGNDVEMWQEQTFDPDTIDEELGWAQGVGINTVRVFMQYIVWEDDPEGYKDRLDNFLEIADSHGISTMPVLFSDSYCIEPFLGDQPDPFPGIHASQWSQSPGYIRLQDHYRDDLRDYVIDVVGHFADDPRIVVWDLFNEPYEPEPYVISRQAYDWARSVNPSQPLTISWGASDLWDVASYHHYGIPLEPTTVDSQRPVVCTETFAPQSTLPYFASQGVGWYLWGLVEGRAYTAGQFDILAPDGTPYYPADITAIANFHTNYNPQTSQSGGTIPAPGAPTCVLNPRADLDGDCIVDILDIAVMASNWLDSSLP